ncbi:Leucine-rich repeat and calponin homology domain-containing protein 4 [Trichoplax sp. H2]|nr:Leucine-rich repeat and calponin homology domain-containing protein 4 [Trichoplax sp. H2]|eukprot:RDD41605.1 Leucine-rich repeat and calponin homology domain-containing protein 4 [Trichoplax sp. H2]
MSTAIYSNKKKSVERCLQESNDIGKLNLSSRKLKSIPNVYFNGLYGVIEADVCFVLIDLSRNRFTQIDWLMNSGDYIQKLNCSHNSIKAVNDIHLLKCLTVLDLSYNKLTSLPPGLGQLPISILNVSHNKISSLSTELSMLQALQDLDLSYNALSSLPDVTVELKRLREINVRHNSLTQLPTELGLLRLTKLDISFNQISYLPPSLCRIATLDVLIVFNNPLVSPPSKICSLGRLHIFKYLSTIDANHVFLALQKKIDHAQFIHSLLPQNGNRNKKLWHANGGSKTHIVTPTNHKEDDTVSELSLSSIATIDTTSSTQSSSLTSDASQLPTLREEHAQLSISGMKFRQNDRHTTAAMQNKGGVVVRTHSIDNFDYQRTTDSPKESPLPSKRPVRLYSEPSGNRNRSRSTPTPPKPTRRRSSLRLSNATIAKNRVMENMESDANQTTDVNNMAMPLPQGSQDRSPRMSATEQELDYEDSDIYDEEYDSSTLTNGKNEANLDAEEIATVQRNVSLQPPPRLRRTPAIKQKAHIRRFASNESLRLFDNDLIREERRRMAKKLQQQQHEMILRQRSESINLSPTSSKPSDSYSSENDRSNSIGYNDEEIISIDDPDYDEDTIQNPRRAASYHEVYDEEMEIPNRRYSSQELGSDQNLERHNTSQEMINDLGYQEEQLSPGPVNRPQSLTINTRTRSQIGSPTKSPGPNSGADARWRVVSRPEVDQIEYTRQLMENILQTNVSQNLLSALSDGILLCYLVNALRPRTIGRVHEPSVDQPEISQAKKFQNVSAFIDVCSVFGMPKHRLCSVGDIMNERDVLRICTTIQEIISILRN